MAVAPNSGPNPPGMDAQNEAGRRTEPDLSDRSAHRSPSGTVTCVDPSIPNLQTQWKDMLEQRHMESLQATSLSPN
ncbi:hypothetical protein N7472_009665 [Penicillium cf. griseofulvum]|uniref:Uncharacterized protein n=1 Tax=Penicillium cf. griseofulvum TaxID=2972120 RepID=A0A9W9M0Q9_9EURO|nr:hypothetical protein N7472_009665 [Penicillium cf. griseofulvum]KAJ5435940.1 hypothetical protein N7445_006825 [Penicillium cf. griseofulvum]